MIRKGPKHQGNGYPSPLPDIDCYHLLPVPHMKVRIFYKMGILKTSFELTYPLPAGTFESILRFKFGGICWFPAWLAPLKFDG